MIKKQLWSKFLTARSDLIVFLKDRFECDDKEIAENLSLDAELVHSIYDYKKERENDVE